MPASASASMRWATSGDGGVGPEQASCPRSWLSRSTLAMPWSRNEALMAAPACWSSSLDDGIEAQPMIPHAVTTSAGTAGSWIVCIATPLSALDRRRDRLGALGIDAHVDPERHRHLRAEARIRKALLPIAVVQPQLHAPHLAVADAIGRPCGEADAVTGVLGQVGQVLQADALAVLAVARRAREIVRAAAKVEHPLAHLVKAALLGVGLRQAEAQATRRRGHVGGQRGHV